MSRSKIGDKPMSNQLTSNQSTSQLLNENQRLKQELTQLTQHAQNLEAILNNIKSAKINNVI